MNISATHALGPWLFAWRKKSRDNPFADDDSYLVVDTDDGSIILNGITIAPSIVDQLRTLGNTLYTFTVTPEENKDEVSCYDEQELDILQREEDQEDIDFDFDFRKILHKAMGSVFLEPSESTGSVFFDPLYREKLKFERDQQREKRKRNNAVHDEQFLSAHSG